MMKTVDYAGNVIECAGSCPACAYANHEFELPCGMTYEDEICTVSQDWQLPINGMIIVAPKRHVKFFDELTSGERTHLFEIVNKVIAILRKNNVAKEFNVLFEEKKDIHFHIWILPRDGWNELGINPTKEIDKLQKYALEHFKTKENFEKIAETSNLISLNMK